MKSNLVVRINYEKCTVALRNQVLVAFAYDRIGETTSLIYAAGLGLLEDKICLPVVRCLPWGSSKKEKKRWRALTGP